MKVVEVPHTRLPRWLDGVVERHGPLAVSDGVVHADDGTVVTPAAWQPLDGVASVSELVRRCAPPSTIGVVALRRGGYAVALDADGEVVARKVGRRHVQSRTAAGGWSQQRFARRRGKQADELLEAVAGHVDRLLLVDVPDGLLVAGDRALVLQLLSVRRLSPLATLPRRTLWDTGDPTPDVLARVLVRARSVRLEIDGPSRD